tara:strand:- start:1032 stop:1442 length:411 start_codon:yes stop_codon:yes gene_type:complete
MPNTEEIDFFKRMAQENKMVGGMADFETGTFILNPFRQWKSPEEKESVMANEALRLFMRSRNLNPVFELTDEQKQMPWLTGSSYKDDDKAVRETIISRLLSGDPSSGSPTKEQIGFAESVLKLLSKFGIDGIRRTK